MFGRALARLSMHTADRPNVAWQMRRGPMIPPAAALSSPAAEWSSMPFAPIEDVIAAIAAGQIVILADDEDRENEGDLVMAADACTPEAIAFMATKACGLICLALDGTVVDRLGLPMMVGDNRSRMGTAFTASIEAADGVTTGISAADRAHTIRVAVDPASGPGAVVSPGHMFPLRARPDGVLERPGQTEGRS